MTFIISFLIAAFNYSFWLVLVALLAAEVINYFYTRLVKRKHETKFRVGVFVLGLLGWLTGVLVRRSIAYFYRR